MGNLFPVEIEDLIRSIPIPGWPRHVIGAMALHETDYWKSALHREHNNSWGLKASVKEENREYEDGKVTLGGSTYATFDSRERCFFDLRHTLQMHVRWSPKLTVWDLLDKHYSPPWDQPDKRKPYSQAIKDMIAKHNLVEYFEDVPIKKEEAPLTNDAYTYEPPKEPWRNVPGAANPPGRTGHEGRTTMLGRVIMPLLAALFVTGGGKILTSVGGWSGIFSKLLGVLFGGTVDAIGTAEEAGGSGDEKAKVAIDKTVIVAMISKVLPEIGRWLLDSLVAWVNAQAGTTAPGASFKPVVEEASREGKSFWQLLFEKATA